MANAAIPAAVNKAALLIFISSPRCSALFGLSCLLTGPRVAFGCPNRNTIPAARHAILTFYFGMLQPDPRHTISELFEAILQPEVLWRETVRLAALPNSAGRKNSSTGRFSHLGRHATAPPQRNKLSSHW
jgi:hypothetical protein